jgi:hypothetical protein
MYEEKEFAFRDDCLSTVDGHLHKKEYEFFFFDCQSIEHRKRGFNDLFHQELPKLPIKNEFQRIQQFYRLAH